MKKLFSLVRSASLAFAILLSACINPAHQTSEEKSTNYGWEQVRIGAGGWVVGMDMHKDGHVMYCRADVGGAYRLDEGSDVWIQLVDTLSMPDIKEWDSHAYGVGSIVSAPSDENVVYMIFANGHFYRSANKGEKWEKKGLKVYVEPNGDGRQQGERIAVDPKNSNIVYYGSNQDGLKRTLDGGSTWEKFGDYPLGITARLNAFEADKNHFGVVYCGFPGNGVAYGFDRDFPPDFSIDELEPVALSENIYIQ